MSVITNNFRYFSSRWLVENANNNNIYCGVSPLNLSIDENYNNISESIQQCHCFCRCGASFVVESDANNYDIKILTKSVFYNTQELVSEHIVNDYCYWRYITIEEALSIGCYNVVLKFNIKNTDSDYFVYLRNSNSFIFYKDFKIDGEMPSQEFNIFDNNKIYTASDIISFDCLFFDVNDDNGRVLDTMSGITLPDYNTAKITYFCSN